MIKSKFIHAKIFAQRTMTYVSILNTMMLLFLILKSLKDYGFNLNLKIWFIPIMVVGLFMLVLIGYIEDRLGMYRMEIEAVHNRSPQLVEILAKVKDIEKRLK